MTGGGKVKKFIINGELSKKVMEVKKKESSYSGELLFIHECVDVISKRREGRRVKERKERRTKHRSTKGCSKTCVK